MTRRTLVFAFSVLGALVTVGGSGCSSDEASPSGAAAKAGSAGSAAKAGSGGQATGGAGGSGGTNGGTAGNDGGATGGSTGVGGSSGAGAGGSAAAAGTGGVAGGSGRAFPDTSSRIAILSDQLPGGMTSPQQQFAATHYVGTQKLTLNLSQPLRAINPNFLVLHYHLAMWQSAPGVTFIVDGQNWDNDYSSVTTHESWFWHNTSGQRDASTSDGKLLMNVSDTGFQGYWEQSLADQTTAGDYDGIFLDSASPALLQGEASQGDPRLAGTAARDTTFTELGGLTWIQAWEAWIAKLDASLASKGIPLIPNTGAFVTTWDNTNYGLTAGIFAEGFSDPSFATSDWHAATNTILGLVAKGKIVILQNYLSSTSDLAKRRYFLANYLLVKGAKTYLFYFATSTLEWYPEWDLDLGAPQSTATTADDLLSAGVYRRDFQNGIVLVNPSTADVVVSLGATFQRVEPQGGGAVDTTGAEPGSYTTSAVTSITVPAKGAEILLR
jgi:hypothetical protein